MAAFLKRFGTYFFFVYVFLSVYGMFWIKTEFNVPFHLAFKYLSLPIFACCYLVAFLFMPNWRRGRSKTALLIAPGIVGGLLLVFSAGYVIYANMIFGEQKTVIIRGTISGKSTTGSRFTEYVLGIRQQNGEILRLSIPKKEFERVGIGDEYSREMTRGGLGLLYSRRW